MKVSEKIAEKTYCRFQNLSFPLEQQNAGAALLSFQGDVFSEIAAEKYSNDQFLFAQNHLRILSGLYGVLRPLDLMQPYRLEMGMRLEMVSPSPLYSYWSEPLTELLNSDLEQLPPAERYILDCASLEYSRTIQKKKLAGTLIKIDFRQRKNGELKNIAIYAKRARGLFSDWCIKNQIATPDQIRAFDRGGYRFDPSRSGNETYCFIKEWS